MKLVPTEIPDVVIVELKVFPDARGHFFESYHADKYRAGGIDAAFVQDNISWSQKGTLRGMHAQLVRPQGKLVQALEGEILDVAADIRKGSPTFGKWVAVKLTGENFRQLYIPPGFVHGFLVLSEHAMMSYKCTDLYEPSGEIGVVWNDPTLAIDWGVEAPLLSDKDAGYPTLKELEDKLPVY